MEKEKIDKKYKRRIYHNNWQNEKYKTDERYREMKKRNAIEWRKRNLERFRKYQREYHKRKNGEINK